MLLICNRVLAVELSPDIRVNAVAQGYKDENASSKNDTKQVDDVPMKRAGHPDEIADVFDFFASEEASYINGVTFPVDGGYLAHD